MSSPKLTTCPENICESSTKGVGAVVRKISGGAGLVFHGDGFYLTDYVHKPDAATKGASAKKTDSTSTSSDASSGSPSDSSGGSPSSSSTSTASDSTSGASSAS